MNSSGTSRVEWTCAEINQGTCSIADWVVDCLRGGSVRNRQNVSWFHNPLTLFKRKIPAPLRAGARRAIPPVQAATILAAPRGRSVALFSNSRIGFRFGDPVISYFKTKTFEVNEGALTYQKRFVESVIGFFQSTELQGKHDGGEKADKYERSSPIREGLSIPGYIAIAGAGIVFMLLLGYRLTCWGVVIGVGSWCAGWGILLVALFMIPCRSECLILLRPAVSSIAPFRHLTALSAAPAPGKDCAYWPAKARQIALLSISISPLALARHVELSLLLAGQRSLTFSRMLGAVRSSTRPPVAAISASVSGRLISDP
jgi:hypothetical protein